MCAPRLGRGGQGGADAGGVGPRRAPQAWLSWRPAVSRPEGANPHCERGKSASRHAPPSGRTLERRLRLGWPPPATAPGFWPLREERGGLRSGSGSRRSSESRGLPVLSVAKPVGESKNPAATHGPGALHAIQGLHVSFGSSCRWAHAGARGPARVRRAPSNDWLWKLEKWGKESLSYRFHPFMQFHETRERRAKST